MIVMREGRTLRKTEYWCLWLIGSAIMVATHIGLIRHYGADILPGTVLPEVIAIFPFVSAAGILLVTGLNGDPVSLIRPARRCRSSPGWTRAHSVLPLSVGTLIAYIASTLWYTGDNTCSKVDGQYFAQISQVIPVLLIALYLQLGYLGNSQPRFRGSKPQRLPADPFERAVPTINVVLLCCAEILAFAVLAKPGKGDANCSLSGFRLEYVAFVVTAQAAMIALATVVWLLLSGGVANELEDKGHV